VGTAVLGSPRVGRTLLSAAFDFDSSTDHVGKAGAPPFFALFAKGWGVARVARAPPPAASDVALLVPVWGIEGYPHPPGAA